MNRAPRRLRRRALLGLIFGLALSAGRTEPADLGDDLRYATAADAPSLAPDDRAVVDLRFAPAPDDDALPAWATPAPAVVRVVLLAGPDATAWTRLLAERSPRVLLLAPADTPPAADLPIDIPTAAARAATEAIAAGSDLIALARPAVDKRRFDESALVRHHNGDTAALENAPAATDSSDSAEATEPPAPPADLMLERAVQVLLGLQALEKSRPAPQ